MKYQVNRERGLIIGITPLDAGIAYQNSVLVNDLEVQCELFPGEILYATFGDKKSDGSYENMTVPLILTRGESYVESGKTIFVCKVSIPNQVLATAGVKGFSLAIQIPRGTVPETYRQVTTGICEFTVERSLGGIGYEEIPASNVIAMQESVEQAVKSASEAARNATIAQEAAESAKEAAKTYEKSFTKGEWVSVNDRYRLIIQQNEHRFSDPYVDKVLIEFEDEDGTHMSEVSYEDKILTVTKAIMVYVDVPLESYVRYSGKIIIKGV